MTSLNDDFSDPSAPADVQNQRFYYVVTAIDRTGNESVASDCVSVVVPDITPPTIDRNMINIVNSAPGSQDYVYGEAGAVSEGGLTVRVYIRFGIPGGPAGSWLQIGSVTSNTNGSFPVVFLGDNLSRDVRIVAVDSEGRSVAEDFIDANDIDAPPAPTGLSVVALGPVGYPGLQPSEQGADTIEGTLQFDPATENLGGLKVVAYADSALALMLDDLDLSSVYSGVTTATDLQFAGANSLAIGDNMVSVAYMVTVDAAGNRSAAVSVENDITPPAAPFFVKVTPGVIMSSENPNLVQDTTDDMISGAVFGDVSVVRVFSDPNAVTMVASDSSFTQNMFEANLGDRVNLAADENYFSVAIDSSYNPSALVAASNDVTAPPINRDFIVENAPGTDDLVSVQTEPNAYVTVFSTSVGDEPVVAYTGLTSPQAIAFAPGGELYAVDAQGSGDAVVVFDGATTPTTVASGLSDAGGLAYNLLTGDLIVSTRVVRPTSVTAVFVAVDPGTGAVADYLETGMEGNASSIVFDYAAGYGYFVVDTKHDIYRFSFNPATGEVIPGSIIKVPGSQNRFRSPQAVALTPDGDPLAVDQRGLGYGQDALAGVIGGVFKQLTSGLTLPFGLAVDTEGNVVISAHKASGTSLVPMLVRVNSDGEVTSTMILNAPIPAIGGAFTNAGDGAFVVGTSASGGLLKISMGADGILLPAPAPSNGIPETAQILAQGFADGAGQFPSFSIGDNLTSEVGIVAIDAAGNFSQPPVMSVNDIFAPGAPLAKLLPYPPGQMDRIEAYTEPGNFVEVYSDASLLNLIARVRANSEGYVAGIDVGDNQYIEFYVAATDAAGNRSDAVRIENDVVAPAAPTATLVMSVPGVEDYVEGIAEAGVVLINVYKDAATTVLVGSQKPASGPYTPIDQAFEIMIGDNAVAKVYVTAVDAAGNESPATELLNDIYAPMAVDPMRLVVNSNPPGQSDTIYGEPYAAEPDVMVNAYADAALSQMVESVTATANGSIPEIDLGDNADNNGIGMVYFQLVDAAGNMSAAVPVENDIVPPAKPAETRVFVVTNAPGTPDEVFGIEGAVEAYASIVIWGDFVGDPEDMVGIAEIASGNANGAGAFQSIVVAENIYTGGKVDPLFIQAVDQAGNSSDILMVGNEYIAYVVMDAFGNIFTGNVEGDDPEYERNMYLDAGLAKDLEQDPESAGGFQVVDGFGNITPVGAAAEIGGVTGFGFDIARDIEFALNESSMVQGFLLDGYGAIHSLPGGGTKHGFPNPPYFWWDVAEDLEIELDADGIVRGFYLLDALGGVHEVGDAQEYTGKPYFNFDIARDLHIVRNKENNTTLGYIVLDGFGGLHGVNVDRPEISPMFGWDIARKLDAPPSGRGVYVVDGMGGIHPVGGAKPIMDAPYFGWDVLKDFQILDVSVNQ